jgi:hypothetical protein
VVSDAVRPVSKDLQPSKIVFTLIEKYGHAALAFLSSGKPASSQASKPPCKAQTLSYPRSRSFCAKLALEPSPGQVQ